MNTKHISLAFAAVVTLLAGCAKSPIKETTNAGGLTDLELAYVGSTEVKSAIDGTDFPQTGEIGLFLFTDEAATTPYGETGYINVKYAYNSTKEKWTASPSIKVGSTPGYLYGYYPYSSTATDIKAISVASSLNGDDVMYAEKQTVNDMTASQTTITMNHALARVCITVKNNGYTGDAKLSKIKFSGAKIAQDGTLNALDGSITATRTDDVTLDVTGEAQAITAAGTTYECLLVPSGVETNKQTVTLTLKIDGEDKTATLSGDNGVIIAQNTKSNITITLSNSGISVQTVSIDDWNVVEIGGYKVTVKMDEDVTAHDVLIDVYVEGDDVIVKANSLSGQHLKCTMPGGEFCTGQSKASNLVYTFTISDITENTTATIGYAKAVSIGVTPSGTGSVEISGGELYEGETVTLKAIPAYEYGFDAWLDKDGNPLPCEEETCSDVRLSSSVMSVKFKENLVLGGEFSVAAGKKVRFTRGNLYSIHLVCKIEQHQYDYNGAEYKDNISHISHFMWCNDIMYATAKQYRSTWDGQSPFFTENEFTVSGFNKNQCRTLTIVDWQYLFSYDRYDNDARRGKYKLGVTVCDKKNCVVLLPDNWTWGSNVDKKEYSYVVWKHMEEAGAVCLPAAGYRNGTNGDTAILDADSIGYYWSASSIGGDIAFDLNFTSDDVFPIRSGSRRSKAYAVRLVTDVK